MIQLPEKQINEALKLCPDLRLPLMEYAQSINESQIGNVSDSVMNILKGNSPEGAPDKVDLKQTDGARTEPDPPGME